MTVLRNIKVLVLLFAFIVLFAGAFTIVSTPTTTAANCCWVRVCTSTPPIVCWDECRPCPPFGP